ncbi:MAG: hypothetical protein R3F55_11125 [Alphaproteobacteria bacterium]
MALQPEPTPAPIVQPRPGAEDQLVDYALRLPDPSPGRIAAHIHLSRLSPQSRRPEYLNVAIANFNAHARVFDGRTFLLGNRDIVFVARDAQPRDVEHAVLKIRYLFPDDPIAQIQGSGDNAFVTYFDLDYDLPLFVDHCEQIRATAQRELGRGEADRDSFGQPAEPGRSRRGRKLPLTPDLLGQLETHVRRADLSSALRRQPICAATHDGALKVVYHELFFTIDDIAAVMMPRHDIRACRWLYRRLVENFDARVLNVVLHHDDSQVRHHVALNLNVATLLSQDFLSFDEAFPGTGRGSILIELDFGDVMADLRAFAFARDMLVGRGYRVCLDGVDHLSLPFVDRGRLGVDFVKFSADQAAIRQIRSSGLGAFGDHVKRNDPSRFVFYNCDSSAAMALGQEYGVHLFQGRHIDGQLAAARLSPRELAVRRTERVRRAG